MEALPTNFTEAYEECLERMEQDPESRQRAYWMLSWLMLPYRPLTTEELQSGLQLTEGNYGLDPNRFLDKIYLIVLCGGLVKINKESGIVSLFRE